MTIASRIKFNDYTDDVAQEVAATRLRALAGAYVSAAHHWLDDPSIIPQRTGRPLAGRKCRCDGTDVNITMATGMAAKDFRFKSFKSSVHIDRSPQENGLKRLTRFRPAPFRTEDYFLAFLAFAVLVTLAAFVATFFALRRR